MRIVILLCVVAASGCTNYFFYPMKQHVLTPDAIGVRYEDVYVETADKLMLHGWKLYSKADSIGTILFIHGNAENISTHFTNVSWLVDHGFDVYLFDYRGYGLSQGEAELDPIMGDMHLLVGYAVERLPMDHNLIIMGQSLGASLSIYAVAHSDGRDRIAALVSVSAFSDYHDIAQDALAKSWIFWLFQWPLSKTISNAYSPVEAVHGVSPLPIFIMHSEADEIIPFYHAQRLYGAAGDPKQLTMLEGGHNVTFNIDNNRQALLRVLDAASAER